MCTEDDVNPYILLMLEGTFPIDKAQMKLNRKSNNLSETSKEKETKNKLAILSP